MTARHALTDLDPDQRLATCAVCGPETPVRIRNTGYGECRTAHRRSSPGGGSKNPRTTLRWRLKRKYNVPAELVEQMVDAIGTETCPICLEQGKPMQVDHDHSCCPGEGSCGRCLRGYICRTCNYTLARFDDDLERLRRAVAYLEAPPLAVI
jgi:hypothetical protein